MAKRKGVAKTSRKRNAGRSAKSQAAGRKRTAKRKSPAARRTASAAAKRKTASKRAARATSSARRPARKTVARKKAVVRKAVARKPAPAAVRRQTTKPAARTVRAAKPKPPVSRREGPVARKAPALNRNRRTLDEDGVPTPPSTLDLDRSASAVRTGRKGLRDRFEQHTETSPALTAGDVDADWESAYSVGDEAPGGDNPTPDQDIVDDIGRAVGVEYQDNEELKGDEKIANRDRHRWELDPASAEDYDEH
jgi:hypothetical protein